MLLMTGWACWQLRCASRRPGAAVTAGGAGASPGRALHFPGRVRRPGGLRSRSGQVDGADLAGRRVPAGRGDIPRRSPKRVPRRQLQSCPARHPRMRQLLQRQTARQLPKHDQPNLGSADKAGLLVPRPLARRSGVSTRILCRTARSTFSSGTATAQWPPGTTVHAASNGKTWEGKSIPGLVDGALAHLANALG